MKKTTTTILATIIFTTGLFAQAGQVVTVNYRIDYIRPDSIYLVEVREKVLAPGQRPETTESPILARDTSEIVAMIANVQKQADEAAAKAKELSTLAAEVRRVYGVLQTKLSELQKQ